MISDPERRRVLDLIPMAELAKWLLQFPNRQLVKVVTIDMWAEYRRIVRWLLPQACIVVDRYHVHNLLNVALKQVLV